MKNLFILMLMLFSTFGFSQVVLAGWTFPTNSGVGSNNIAAECGIYVANSNLYANGTNGSSTWDEIDLNLEFSTGTNINTPVCNVNTNSGSIVFRSGTGSVNNGKSFVFKTSTLNYQDINFNFAVRSTTNAFTTHTWDYSFDGSTWQSLITYTDMNVDAFAIISPLNGSNADFNNKANVYLRCQLSGSTAGGSRVRFDNVKISGTAMPAGPNMSASTCGKTYDVVPGELIASEVVVGATNYRFRILDEDNNEYFIERENGEMTIQFFAQELGVNFEYGKDYSIASQAFVGGEWTALGTACTFSITNDPKTKVRADLCDVSIPSLDTQIFADRLPLYNNYVFEIEDMTNGGIETITRNTTFFRLTQHLVTLTPSFNTTYKIRVRGNDGVNNTSWGTYCEVNTPALPPVVKLRVNSCGVTINTLAQGIQSEIAIGANEYTFEVTNLTTNAVQEIVKPSWTFQLTELVGGVTNGVIYSVRVKAKGPNSAYNAYGDACLVATPGTRPTIASTTCNKTYDMIPGETISLNLVAGATNYRFRFVDSNLNEILVTDNDGTMTIHQFASNLGANFAYGQTYTVSAQAFFAAGIWTSFGTACTFSITNDPKTKVRADFCDLTIPTLDTQIFADRLPLYNNYIFEIEDITNGGIETITRGTTGFRLTQHLITLTPSYATTYKIRVKANDGMNDTNWGVFCEVTTPTVAPAVKLRANSCDITMNTLGQGLQSEIAVGATEYTFEVTNLITNAVEEIVKSSWTFQLTELLSGVTYGTTYTVRVKAKASGVYNNYGDPCNVTTPSIVPVQLTALYCGQTFSSYRSLYANRVNNAQEFTFEVTNQQTNEVLEVVRLVNFFHLQIHTNPTLLSGGTSFSVRVKVKIAGAYGNYGNPCVVTIGVINLLNHNLNDAATNQIEAYPNPFTNNFTVKLADFSTASIQVFDINGRMIENRMVDNIYEVEMGLNLSQGVYVVRVEQNGETQSFKMIKK